MSTYKTENNLCHANNLIVKNALDGEDSDDNSDFSYRYFWYVYKCFISCALLHKLIIITAVILQLLWLQNCNYTKVFCQV